MQLKISWAADKQTQVNKQSDAFLFKGGNFWFPNFMPGAHYVYFILIVLTHTKKCNEQEHVELNDNELICSSG